MGVDRPPTSRQAAFEALVGTLQDLHGGVHANDMARALFQYATGPVSLVGLAAAGERAVFYDANTRTLTAIPLDAHGLDHPAAERLRGAGDPATWLEANADDVAWVHPRYRDGPDDDRTRWGQRA